MTTNCMTCEAPATQTRMNGLYPCCDTCAAAKDKRTANRLSYKGLTNEQVIARNAR